MWINVAQMLMALALILTSCEFFTNGIEWLGRKLGVGDGVVGSIFSAVGTCLPETMIPIIAILFLGEDRESMDVGVGAILGAPFMLSTLAFFVVGASVILFRSRRGTGITMHVNSDIVSRDISFFLVAYSVGVATAFINIRFIKRIVSAFLVATYIYYIILTVRQDSVNHGHLDELYLAKIFGLKNNMHNILLQICISLAGIIFGANIFVKNIEYVSDYIGITPIILSLIVTPIVTELPEKFNSIIWIARKKDTLALGNITGAMVFQSCIPVSIGILATPWQLNSHIIVSSVMATLSASTIYFWIEDKGKLNLIPLLMGGAFYALFIISLFMKA
ncbi:MAG TPA: sodium:calcium antiporter [Acetivibrio sp.]|uniref:sodium:calcium antiporter n=1 Tax=Acetivibrio sp. TaxID=1872092 RepID=UPI002BB67990|nr:sodium:calcium antiporter [Acetivibrio sp.]HOM03696.1 sodium:calcium antiporter [Acetivibrio sp.]